MMRVVFTLLVLLAQAVPAQVNLPAVRLPTLPQAQLPPLDRLSSTTSVDVRALHDVRRLQVLDLLRRHRNVLEADPNGAAIVRGEILALAPTDSDLNAVQAAGFAISRTHELEGLDTRVVVLAVPRGMNTPAALSRLRVLLPAVSFDFNHVYTMSGRSPETPSNPGAASLQTRQSAAAAVHRSLGLIDSGVDTAHPVFKDVPVHPFGCGGHPVPAEHGTAVASIMVGRSVEFHGAASGADLYAADVYCGSPTGGAVDAIAEAFAWLAREHVAVINVSLVGPPNATLEAVVRSMSDRGHLIVAAVGNDGPAAGPLYPASYPGVVGVTGVDRHRKVLFEACRGPQVKFAAPGADMSAARSPREFDLARGTSFASPIVAALLGQLLQTPERNAAARAVEELAHQAIDLGAPGLDPVYGYGLVGADLAPEPRLASIRP